MSTPNTNEYDVDDRQFNVSTMQIMIDVDGKEKAAIPFTLDMLYSPELEKDPPVTTSKLPFFTRDGAFPSFTLQMANLKYRIEFFFNINKFNRIMNELGDNWMSEDDIKQRTSPQQDKNVSIPLTQTERENEQSNVETLLRSLFPISSKFDTALVSSYDRDILQKTSFDVIRSIDPLESINIFGFMDKFGFIKPDRGISYLKNKKRTTNHL